MPEIADNWESTDPVAVAGYLYGDILLAEQGHATAGVPAYAGFAVGADLIDSWVRIHREVEESDLLRTQWRKLLV